MEKLALLRWRWILFAGWAALTACAQDSQEPAEVGTTQVELRSQLELPDGRSPHLPSPGKAPGYDSGQSPNRIQPTRRISLTGPGGVSPDPKYDTVHRYEFLPALLVTEKPGRSRKGEGDDAGQAWTLGEKPEASAGKGFGVAAEGWTSPGSVHLDNAHYYAPAVAFQPLVSLSEAGAQTSEPKAGKKRLIFHGRGTGWSLPPVGDEELLTDSRGGSSLPELRPIPETQVRFYGQPHDRIGLTPSQKRLDLLNGNENFNRHHFQTLP